MIYAAYNKITGKYYVGKTIKTLKKRRYAHEWLARHDSQTYFHRALRKYGTESFWWAVLSDTEKTKESRDYLEKYFIRGFNSRSTENGYNMTDGGDGGPCIVITEESRKKRSDALKGRIFSAEHCRRISEAKKGTRVGCTPWNKGIPMTEKAREKLKKSLRERKQNVN